MRFTVPVLTAAIEAIDAELGDLPAAVEAGRVFSGANEQALRAVAQAINALLAQVQQAPVVGGPDQQPPAGAPPAGAPPAVPPQREAAEPDGDVIAQESVVALSEAAKGGRGLIKVIDAGWGTSGYYAPDVLARDAGTAFPTGTKMYWDHPTEDEARNRPERSLRDLAAETTGPAEWMDRGPDGPGVYAPASVFSAYRPAIEELSDHIGVSIRAAARVRHGERDGRKGSLIERLLPSPTNSIDFVTIPGRGGKVAALFEAARGRNMEDDIVSEAELRAAQEAMTAEKTRADEAEARAQRAETAAAVASARTIATETLRTTALPDPAKEAVLARVSVNPPIVDGALDVAAFTAAVTAEATREQEYIDRVVGKGIVRGMGSGSAAPATAPDMTGTFLRLGLSESAAKVAAAGRR